jgi:segregation and condensation protein B
MDDRTDDITRILQERERALPPDEKPRTDSATGEPVVSAPADSAPSEKSGMVLVAAIERPAGATEGGAEPARPVPTREQIVEALLFAATAPLTENRLREILHCSNEELVRAIDHLNQEHETTKRAFRIHRIAQGYQLYTREEYAEYVRCLFKTTRAQRLTRASLETLAIVAYRQPVTKPEIEQLRGVDTTAPLLTLLERRLILLAGRAHKPGNPFLYRTSKEFLRYFGLTSLEDLPRQEELEEFLRVRADQAEAEAEADMESVLVGEQPAGESVDMPVPAPEESAAVGRDSPS